MSAGRGKVLEGMIILGAREYERRGVASVFHRPTRKIWTARGWVYPEKAGCDFNGNYNGTAITFEAKETKLEALPLANIHAHQIDALFANRKGISGLVIGFFGWLGKDGSGVEVYWVPYAALADFLANKWRESLSRDWCRAYGELCRIETNAAGKPRVMFLATMPHPECAKAMEAVAAERASAMIKTPKLAAEFFAELEGDHAPLAGKPRRELPRTSDGKIDPIGVGMRWGSKARGTR